MNYITWSHILREARIWLMSMEHSDRQLNSSLTFAHKECFKSYNPSPPGRTRIHKPSHRDDLIK